MLEWAERDAVAKAVVHAALGRFAEMLGGLSGCLAMVRREEIEQAFDVPGAGWITLERYDWARNDWIAEELGGDGAVLDIGCGYGCSSVPFAQAGREVVGVDENLLFLLLFGRYARERDLPGTGYACIDVAQLPLPFADRAFNGVLAASFFNHYACLRTRDELREFLDETARVAEPGGGFVADMVPNRLHPFPSEINLGEVITEEKLRRGATGLLRRIPVRWLPGRLTAPGLWVVYRLYCAARRRTALGLAAFRSQVSKALPEAGVGGLPLTARGWPALARAFSSVEVRDNSVFSGSAQERGTGARVPYFVLSCRR